MKNKIINAYIYSYASLLVIIASYKIIDLLLHKNYMDAFADLFINYQGGFIRRGLIGSLLLSIYQISGISPIALAIVLSIAAYSFIFLYCLIKLKPYKYGFAFLTPCYLLGGHKDKFQVNDRKGIMFYLCLSYIFQIPMYMLVH